MIGNEVAEKITKVLRSSPQNSSEIVTNETENSKHDKEITKEKYIFPE